MKVGVLYKVVAEKRVLATYVLNEGTHACCCPTFVAFPLTEAQFFTRILLRQLMRKVELTAGI